MSVLATISTQSWRQMTIRWQITAILMTLPPNAYAHLNICIFYSFSIETYLMIYFITKTDTYIKYQFSAFIWYQDCVHGVVICVEICQETFKEQPYKNYFWKFEDTWPPLVIFKSGISITQPFLLTVLPYLPQNDCFWDGKYQELV